MPTPNPVPSDLIDRVIDGENFHVDNVIDCLWLSQSRLAVTSAKGGFTRTVTAGSKENVRGLLTRIVNALNSAN